MKTIQTIRTFFLRRPGLFIGLAVLWICSACEEDSLEKATLKPDGAQGITLSISAAPLSKKVMTRAASLRHDRSLIRTLDIVPVNTDGTISSEKIIHLNAYSTPETGKTEADSYLVSGSLAPDEEQTENNVLVYHIGTGMTENIDINNIHIIANYIGADGLLANGLPLDNDPTLDELLALKQGFVQGSTPVNLCTMYGKWQPTVSGGDHGHTDTGVTQTVQLTRTKAMVTLAIDGSRLREGVTVQPVSMTMRQVPSSCLITQENRPASTDEIEDRVTRIIVNWSAVACQKTIEKLKQLGSIQELSTQTPMISSGGPHGNSPNVTPLFLFENLQGTNGETSDNEAGKTPADGKEGLCSYIEVVTRYHYSTGLDGNADVTKVSNLQGTVTYRFYLGGNTTNDFNVYRNKHYQLTLNLSGWGGLEEDGKINANGQLVENSPGASWRVETDHLQDIGLITDNVDIPVGGSRFDMNIMVDENLLDKVQLDFTNANGVGDNLIWAKNQEDQSWKAISSKINIDKNGESYVIDNHNGTYKIEFYIKPWTENQIAEFIDNPNNSSLQLNTAQGWIDNGFREISFSINKLNDQNNPESNQTFTLKQWLPLPVLENGNTDPTKATLFYSRFDVLHGTLMPWGPEEYNDVDLHAESSILQTSGLGITENNQSVEYSKTNGFHNVVAFFLTDRNRTGGSKIDFNNGDPKTVMEYAAFEAANAEDPDADEGGGQGSNTALLITNPIQATGLTNYGLISVEEWKQIEKDGLKDLHFPLIEGVPYWTSNVADNESGESGVLSRAYHYGYGVAKAYERSSKFRARMVYRRGVKATFTP